MKIFPDVDTSKERKRFVIFHACTFPLCSIIGVFIMLYFNKSGPTNSSNMSWLIISLLIWSAQGF